MTMRLTQGLTPAVLGAVIAVALMRLMVRPAAEPAGSSSNRPASGWRQQKATTPGLLEARLDDLKQPLPGSADTTRNPFRFRVKPSPPPQPSKAVVTPAAAAPQKPDNRIDTPPLPLPVAIKCIGTARQGKTEVAIFSDGKGLPVWAREGQTVLGEYRLLTIGVESVTMSHLDGSGRQTIPFGPR